MIIEYENEEIENLVKHNFSGRYKKFKSNAKLIKDLDSVMSRLLSAPSVESLRSFGSLHYEKLVNSDRHSVRVGHSSKYRLEFYVFEEKITLLLIEISEHYGEH